MGLEGALFRNIRVIELLGQGGMGQVFLGYDEKLQRQVAVKLMRSEHRLDADSKHRFLREARILGQLEHPNICQVFDFIEEEEQDILVMELVRGQSLAELRAAEIPLPDKLAIAEQIADVLVAAHSMSVVHRDLKPENVMVGEELRVKVLDFGLARSLRVPDTMSSAPGADVVRELSVHDGALTRAGRVMGTPSFMSPEQARGESVTAASDMYSFGLLLQHLFSASPAYEAGLDREHLHSKAMWGETQAVSGVEPQLARLIEELKAFKPGDRPSALSAAERLRFIIDGPRRRRRQRLVAAVWALLLLFATGMGVQSWRAAREARRATAEAAAAAQVSSFLVELFRVVDPEEGGGARLTAQDMLERGVQRLESELLDQPELRARLQLTIGTVYHELGFFDQARAILVQALEFREQRFGSDAPHVAECLQALAVSDAAAGDYEQAEARYLRCLAIRQAAGEQVLHGNTLNSLLGLYLSMGRFAEGHALYARAREVYADALADDDPRWANLLHNYGMILRAERRFEEAVPILRQALHIDLGAYGENHPKVASSLESLASVLWAQGELEEARRLSERASAIFETVLGPQHPHLAQSLNTLAYLYYSAGDAAAAETTERRAVAIYEAMFGEDHPHLSDLVGNLAVFVSVQEGRLTEAEALNRRAIAIAERTLGPDHPKVAASCHNLAVDLRDQGRYADAEALFERALRIREAAFGPDSPVVATTLDRYAQLLRSTGRAAEAVAMEERVRQIEATNPS